MRGLFPNGRAGAGAAAAAGVGAGAGAGAAETGQTLLSSSYFLYTGSVSGTFFVVIAAATAGHIVVSLDSERL